MIDIANVTGQLGETLSNVTKDLIFITKILKDAKENGKL